LERAVRIIVLIVLLLGFAAVVCGGFIFILSGGQVFDYLQTAVIRFSLSMREDELNQPMGSDETPIHFTVASGDNPQVIAHNLVGAKLISDADLFVDYVRAEGLDTELEAGTYFLNQTQNMKTIAVMLTDSRSSVIPFRILEGWRVEEIAEAIDENPLFDFSGQDFLALVGRGAQVDSTFALRVGLPQGASLEGFLFPDTYELPAGITALRLRNTLTETFLDRTGTQLFDDAASQDFSMYEIVTLASIIEREAVHDDEHPLIASAYRNRLTNGWRLEADPTVQYPIGFRGGRWWPLISPLEYTSVISDYNTYINFGLPPGPIASPGLSAIRAAVYPVESSYFYFRASCSRRGYHEFATTFDEHLANAC
jgi:UPF0755 protein